MVHSHLVAIRCVGVALLVASVGSCAREPVAPMRFEVSGNATYEGQPIPSGMVVFEDVKSLYRSACSIENGYYKSQPGKGHQGGKFRVEMTAFENQPASGQLGTPLWEGTWTREVELPEDAATLDFHLTAADINQAPHTKPIPTDPEPEAAEPSGVDESP